MKANLFNVGMHRREKLGNKEKQDAAFFSSSDPLAKQKREALAFAVLDELLQWLEDEGDLAVFDATNTTPARRQAVLSRCQAKSPELEVLFIESICDDKTVIENNLLLKAKKSPDYRDKPLEEALNDLRLRVAEYVTKQHCLLILFIHLL